MKTIKKTFILILSLITVQFYSQESAFDIVKKMDDKIKGKSTQAEITVKIKRQKWDREMSMKLWTKGADYSMVFVTAPIKEKGNAFLKRKKEVWNWVPGIEKIIKLPPSMMSQSWMGTDFTNDDLVKHSSILNDYTHTLSGETTLADRVCHKIIMTPKPDAAVVWSKVIVFIDKKDYIQMRAEYYNEDNELVNILTGSDIKMLGGKLLASKIEMVPADKKANSTTLIYKSLVFDQDINDNFFTPDKMKNIQ
jgi:outer membrane lipoprotein-sorting protein